MKKIYIAGPITGVKNYRKKFAKAEAKFIRSGYTVLNPAVMPEGLTFDEYMMICFAMMSICDTIYFLHGWERSVGACQELKRARANRMENRMEILFEDDEL